MMEIFQGSDVEELIQHIFAHIKSQIENPVLPTSGFTLDSIMHLGINFHKPVLTWTSSYIKLSSWTTLEKVVVNPKKPMT